MELGERTRSSRSGALVVMMFLLGALAFGFAPGSVSAAPAQDEPASNISITQTPSGGGGICLPAFLAMTHSVGGDAQTFRLRIEVNAPLCSRLDAVAVIYAMPGNGVAWPQNFVESQGFSLQQPGVTEIVFTKTCEPVQFDVVTGATPATISPDGAWHGPLLFPFDINTSQQWWGCGPPPTTTTSTTTTSSTTTTIANNCDDYTPSGVTVTPVEAAPGAVVTVAGTGAPGTLIQVVLRPTGTGPGTVTALSNPVLVQPDGSWTTPLDIPLTADPGPYDVAANAVDCNAETIAGLTVVASGTPTTTPPSTQAPVVAGETAANELPEQAVALGTSEARGAVESAESGDARAAGLAFTGAGARLPVIIAVTMIAAGGLLLLRSRRRTA